jgi:hypothetical protein
VPVSFFVVDQEADFDADFAGAVRLLLDCEDPSFLFVAMVIPSSAGAASWPCRGAVVLSNDNDNVAVRFARPQVVRFGDPGTSASGQARDGQRKVRIGSTMNKQQLK